MADLLFTGCTIQSRLPFVESAFRFVLERLGMRMEDHGGNTCCMEPVGLRSMSQRSWLRINARHHSIADGKRIVTLCEGCNLSLSESADIIRDEASATGGPAQSVSDVSGTLQFMFENLEAIREKVTDPIGRRMAFFPGCHCEYVCSKKGSSAILMMQSVLDAIGIVPLRPADDLCCGGSVSMIDADLDRRILSETIGSFKDMGPEAVVTACPFCFMRFDMAAKYPSYHLAEVVAMAMGHADTIGYHVSKQVQ